MVKTFVIGLTGGLASGKTTVANLFAQLNVPIIDTDTIARQLVERNQPALKEIVDHFGQEILQADGTLNRKKLKNIIFDDATEKVWLEHCLHRRIYDEIKKALETIDALYCLVVIPLLTECYTLFHDLIDHIIVVDASVQTQKVRVSSRDHLTHALIEKMLSSQASREERLAIADTVLTNDGSLDDLKGQILGLHDFFTRLSLIY